MSATMATIHQNDTQRTQLDPVSMEISAEVTSSQLKNTETSVEALRTPGTPAVGSEREELTTPPSGDSSNSPGSFHTGVPLDWEVPGLRQEQAPPPEARATPCLNIRSPQGFLAQVSQANT